jgi:ferric-dicitrate binding protein FerR (iron transport regulator)
LNKHTLLQLAQKYLDGTATEEEKQALHTWYDTADDEELEMVLSDQPESAENVEQRIFAGIQRRMHDETAAQDAVYEMGTKRKRPALWLAAAAVIGIMLCSIAYFFYRNTAAKQIAGKEKPASSSKKEDVLPGSDKAKLVLGNGAVVLLEDTKDGAIRDVSGIKISKQNGRLLYDASVPSQATSDISFNTLSTPRGGQYHVILPDGSKVWLNASSSLRFPTAFTGHERRVELTGEAYFEIAHNGKMPFIATINNTEVEVLGTHFNIMGYNDEGVVKTTLLEGRVKVTPASGSQPAARRPQLLSPGQQAVIDNNSSSIRVIRDIDVEETVAWKNGLFLFNNTDIQTIMRQIARWYDVEITYEGPISARYFSGEIPRNVPVSQVLKLLELSDVRFRLEGKNIIVLH